MLYIFEAFYASENSLLFNIFIRFQINLRVGDFYVWMGLSRREEIVITRACIGHTYFTHSYLLKAEEMPWCIPCNCPDTVKHILLDCIDLRDTRIKYYRHRYNQKVIQ